MNETQLEQMLVPRRTTRCCRYAPIAPESRALDSGSLEMLVSLIVNTGPILLGGVQGTGKTDIGRLVNDCGIPVEEVTTLMVERLQKQAALEHRDQLRDIPWGENQRLFQEVVGEYLDRMQGRLGVLIVHPFPRRKADAHYPLDFGQFVGRGIVGNVVIWSDPHEIYERIQKDTGRRRAATTPERIAAEQKLYMQAARLAGEQLGVDTHVIVNRKNQKQITAAEIVRIVRA
jgi:adenylate kinase